MLVLYTQVSSGGSQPRACEPARRFRFRCAIGARLPHHRLGAVPGIDRPSRVCQGPLRRSALRIQRRKALWVSTSWRRMTSPEVPSGREINSYRAAAQHTGESAWPLMLDKASASVQTHKRCDSNRSCFRDRYNEYGGGWASGHASCRLNLILACKLESLPKNLGLR